MSDPSRPDRETLLHQEVERAVSAYAGRVPEAMLAKLRELAERYYRSHPEAIQVLDALGARAVPVRSGEIERDGADEVAPPAATGAGRK